MREYLRQLLPGLARVAVVFSSQIPTAVEDFLDVQAVAPSMGIEAQAVGIAATEDLEPSLEAALAGDPQAILAASGIVPQHDAAIVSFANQHGLPTAGLKRSNKDWENIINEAKNKESSWKYMKEYFNDELSDREDESIQ